MDRRGATRYRLQLVVTFSWKDDTGMVHGSEGQSRDVNGRGIYIESPIIPPLGSSVAMNVLLPQVDPIKRLAELHADGRVVRIDSSASPAGPNGFATMNHTVVFRDADGRPMNGEDPWKEFGVGE